MLKNKLNYRLINILLVMAIVYILYLTSNKWGFFIGKIISVSFPFIVGFAIAYVLNPFVKFLESKGVRRGIAVTVIILLVLIVIVGILWATLPLVYDQLILFSKSVINLFTDLSNNFDVNLGEFSNTIMDALNKIISGIGSYVSNGTISLVNKGVKIVTNTIIIIAVSIYFLIDMDKIRNNTRKFLKSRSEKTYGYVKKLDTEIGNYFHGLVIFMTIQFFEYSILFRLANHPNWLILGVLACVTTVIPYFGGYITNIIAVITAFTVSTPVFIATLLICAIFPNVDGYFISPRIYGKTNNTKPIIAIFMLALFSSLFGFIGIVIAMPTYIIIKASIDYFEEDIRKFVKDMMD